MQTTVDSVHKFFQIIAVIGVLYGIYIAREKWLVERERFRFFTFLKLGLDEDIIQEQDNLSLVAINIHLENTGWKRISARRYKDLKGKETNFLYNDNFDQCKHAGTLKIRKMPDNYKAGLFDWYSLIPINNVDVSKDGKQFQSDLEQLNFLEEFEDPLTNYHDVDFWLEPSESYHQQIMIWLPKGVYVVKAYFLGNLIKYEEEEYWSSTKIIKV